MSDHETETELLAVNLNITAEMSFILSKKKACGPPSKETKNKEFSLMLYDSRDSYTRLLQAIVDQHGKKTFKPKASQPYPIKYFLPRTTKKNAIDVENFEKFQSMIQRLKKKSARSVTLVIQFEDVKKCISRQSCNAPLDDIADMEDGDIEAEDSDNELPVGDWAIAMKDNIVTINEPPRTALFDPNNKRPILNLHCTARASTVTAPALDVNTLASAFAPIMGVVAELAKVNMPTNSSNMLRTSKHRHTGSDAVLATPTSLPALDPLLAESPNSLAHFCKFMKDTRGVCKAPEYFLALRNNGYGLDILSDVNVKELMTSAPAWCSTRTTCLQEKIEDNVDFSPFVIHAGENTFGDPQEEPREW
ncbi:hypothetical protein BDY19DRAFT_993917 [Irpex rosettiformis]|uniref:Uncharacterized protein n=1 Tax=Irpex rosettiformis TaxID=378272 RepID=A0ACB8U2Q8_9APHY|nr:hypothetical protein BDY19DRAFT_993917 [Irpex rosettiformis]